MGSKIRSDKKDINKMNQKSNYTLLSSNMAKQNNCKIRMATGQIVHCMVDGVRDIKNASTLEILL